MEVRDETKVKEKNKRKSIWRVLILTAAVLIVVLAAVAAYIWRAGYFTRHFYKDTWINGIDCSYMTAEEVKKKIQEQIDSYDLTITDREGDSYVITGPQLHLTYVDDYGVDDLLAEQKPLEWLQRAFQGGKYQVSANFSYEESSVEPILDSLPFIRDVSVIQPENAYMQETDTGYEIVPEVEGNGLDREKVLNLIKDSIQNGVTQLSLTEEDCYLKPEIYRDNEELNTQVNMMNQLTRANLTYQVCGETYVVDHKVLKSWLTQDEQGTYTVDMQQIEKFISQLADMRDTYGGKRKFTTHSGEKITLSTNKYGWLVDREKSIEELTSAIAEGKQGEMELVYEKKGQGTGKDDLGNIYVEISIDQQTMWCYKDGQVVVETPVVTGNMAIPGHATPKNGCWPIFWKKTEYTMKGPRDENGEPEYTAFVHYWMPFNNGVGIHDLASRGNNFGGDIYLTNGSHGCINTPLKAAKTIFETVSVGTPVIVY